MTTGITRLIFITCALFLLHRESYAQAPAPVCKVNIDLLNVSPDKDRVKVTITPPPVQSTVINYILPKYIPGVPGPVDAGRFIHQFYALDDKGFPLKVKKKGENTIVMKMHDGATLKKIEYWIDDTWDAEKPQVKMSDEKFNYVPQPAGSNIESGSNFVINHAFYFGYIEGFESVPYIVTVSKPDAMIGSSALPITPLTRTRDEYRANSYAELIDNPVMYCAPDTVSFLSGNVLLHISVFSENGKVTARQVRKLIAAQIAASTNFIGDQTPQDYEMLFYFTTPFRTVLNIHGGYDGLAHRKSAFYFMPELADEDALANEILRETSGDVLHLWPPLDYRFTDGHSNFLKPQLSEAWWFCKGTNLYFGWLSAVRDSFVSEGEFMGAVSEKIRLLQMTPNKALTDLNMVQQMNANPLQREAINARAMLTAFLLDIQLTEASGGKTGLREAVLYLSTHKKYPADSLEAYLAAFGGEEIHAFFANYVNGYTPLPFNESLSKIGWAYAPEALDSVLTFGKFGLTYDDERDAYFVHNADTSNLFGLRNGDRIISVDHVNVNAMSFDEALSPVYNPKENDEVEIRFIRGEENTIHTAKPATIAILVHYLIRNDPAAGTTALQLHKDMLQPKAATH